MTNCIIHPVNQNSHKIGGMILASPSKSQTLRAILFSSLADGNSTIKNVLLSPDAKAMINSCIELGANIQFTDKTTLSVIGVSGKLKQPDDVINAGNSGIVLRFIAAICALLNSYTVITGDHSIRHNRPVKPLLEALKKLGVFAESMRGDDMAPIILKGPIVKNITELDGQDSQPVSALIIASLLTEGDTIINVTNPGEKPWLDLTLNWLDKFNLKYSRKQHDQFTIPGKQVIPGFDYFVASDLSSISFPIALAVLTRSSVTIKNVDLSDPQGDKLFIDILNNMGANITYNEVTKELIISDYKKLSGVTVDINNCIDVINILSVVSCFADGETTITGAKIARSKECDRISCIANELTKMGADIKEFDDGLTIKQSDLIPCNHLETYNDHRMVMALFVASVTVSLKSGVLSDSIILNTNSVAKSYPDFFNHMQQLGCEFEMMG